MPVCPRPATSVPVGSLAAVALALYRKYRPARFSDVVGQEHVTDPIRRDVAARVGGLIWVAEQPESEPTETKTETRAHRGEGHESG